MSYPETQSKCTCEISSHSALDSKYGIERKILRCDFCKSLESTNAKLVELLKVAEEALHEVEHAKRKMNSQVGAPFFAQECLEYAARKAREALSQIKAEVK